MIDTNCTMTSLAGADLRDATLRHAKFFGVDMQGVNLNGTQLERIDMRGVNLLRADLRDASFVHSQLDEVTWPLLSEDALGQLRQEVVDVTTPSERLSNLAWNWPGIIFQEIIATNPNIDSKTLRELAYLHPVAFLRNPVLPLLSMEQPDWLNKDEANIILIALAIYHGMGALDASQRQLVRWLHQRAHYVDYPHDA